MLQDTETCDIYQASDLISKVIYFQLGIKIPFRLLSHWINSFAREQFSRIQSVEFQLSTFLKTLWVFIDVNNRKKPFLFIN